MNSNTPKTVMEVAKGLVERYGDNFKKLGNYNGQEVYLYKFPDKCFTGFPYVFLYDSTKDIAIGVTGFQALKIVSLFR